MANRSPRVDYDIVAPLYDSQPYRVREADREFSEFIDQTARREGLSVLDVGCGTGNQLVANHTVAPHAELVGVDRSLGMLRQARPKAPDIVWVRADAAALPFPNRSFDFVSCQYAFHHFAGKASMLREAFRVLRPAGRFVLRNLCPQESSDWLYYEYFPEAEIVDLQDFWPPEAIAAVMEGAGFTKVSSDYDHLHFDQDLAAWLEVVRRRDTCSQLQAIPDAAYQTGLHRLERELADRGRAQSRADHLCLITIRGEKPVGHSL
jgi:SAM-dependent methyltransferase